MTYCVHDELPGDCRVCSEVGDIRRWPPISPNGRWPCRHAYPHDGPCEAEAASPAALDVTDKDAVLDRLHNDPVARYFYEAGKAEGRVALRPLEPADPIVCEAASPAALDEKRLREALEHVLDVWPAPSPEEFARLHRVLTGHDSCAALARLTEQEAEHD